METLASVVVLGLAVAAVCVTAVFSHFSPHIKAVIAAVGDVAGWHWPEKLAECHWCQGFWYSLGLTFLFGGGLGVTVWTFVPVVLGAWAVSGVTVKIVVGE